MQTDEDEPIDLEWISTKKSKLQELTEYIQERHSKGELLGYNFSIEPSETASIEDYAESVLNLLKSSEDPRTINMTAHLEAGGDA